MDNPYLRRDHSHRFQPLSPSPYPENPNFYPSNHLNHHSYPHHPPPPPPPPHPPRELPCPRPRHRTPSYHDFSARQPPPQHPPYDPHQFVYTPQHVLRPSTSSAPSPLLQFRDWPLSPYRLHRETRPDMRNPVATAGCSYQFDYRYVSPDRAGDRFNVGLDDRYRSRDDVTGHASAREEFGSGRVYENHYHGSLLVSKFGKHSRDLGFGNRGKESNVASGHGVNVGVTSDGAREIQRLDDDRLMRDSREQMFDTVRNGIANLARAGDFSQENDYYFSEIERYINEGNQEVNHKLNRTPSRQGQRKSVLLRLQTPKPNQRIRDDERLHNSGYFDVKKSSPFKFKDQLRYSDRGAVEKQRQGTPMQLDVSFKSNTLVAKAVTGAAGTSAASGMSVTPRSSKIRKVMRSDQDCKFSPCEGTTKRDSKVHASNLTSGAEKALKQSKNNIADFGADINHSGTTEISSSCAKGSNGNINLEKPTANTGSGKINTSLEIGNYSNSLRKSGTTKVINSTQCAVEPLQSVNMPKQSAGKVTASGVDNKVDTVSKPSSARTGEVKMEKSPVLTALNGESGHSDNAAQSAVEPLQSVEKSKESTDKVAASGVENKVDIVSKPSSAVTNSSDGEVKVEKSPLATARNGEEGQSHAEKLPLAKELTTKKVLRKARKPPSELLGSLTTDKSPEPVKAINSCCGVSSFMQTEEGNKCCEKQTSVSCPGSQPCATEVSPLPDTGERNGSEDSLTVEVAINTGSEQACVDKINKKRRRPISPLGSSIHEKVKADKTVTHMGNLSNNAVDTAKSLIEFTISDTANPEDSSNHIDRNGDPFLPENRISKDTEVFSSTGEKGESGKVFGAEKNHLHEDSTYPKDVISEVNTGINFDLQNQGHNPVNRKSYSVGEQDWANKVSSPVEGPLAGVSVQAIPSKDSTAVPGSSEVSAVPDTSLVSNLKNGGLERTSSIFNGDKDSEKTAHRADNDVGKQVYLGEFTTLPESSTAEGDSDLMSEFTALPESSAAERDSDVMSQGTDKGVLDIFRNCQILISLLDRTLTAETSAESLKLASSMYGAVATSHAKNSSHAGSSVGDTKCLDAGLNPCLDGSRTLHESSLTEANGVLLQKCSGGGSLNSMGSVEGTYMDSGLQNSLPRVNFSLVSGDLVNGSKVSYSASVLAYEQVGNSLSAGNKTRDSLTEIGSDEGEKLLAAEEQLGVPGETALCPVPGVDLCPVSGNSLVMEGCSSNLSCPGFENLGNKSPHAAGGSCQDEIMDNESFGQGLRMDANGEQVMDLHKTPQCGNSLKHQHSCLVRRSTGANVESDKSLVLGYSALASDQGRTPTKKLGDDLMECASDTPSGVGSPEILQDAIGINTSNSETGCFPTSDQSFCGSNRISDGNCTGVVASSSAFSAVISDADASAASKKCASVSVSAVDLQNKVKTVNLTSRDTLGNTNYTSHTVPKSYSSSSFVKSATRNLAPKTHITKSRTWCRTSNSPAPSLPAKSFSGTNPPEGQLPKKGTEIPNSYIRKGNSLLRKPPRGASADTVSLGKSLFTYQLNDSGANKAKGVGSECIANANNPPNLSTTKEPLAASARPSTPLLDDSKTPNRDTLSSGSCLSSPSSEHQADDCSETQKLSVTSPESNVRSPSENGVTTSETPLNQMGSNNASQHEARAANVASSAVGRIAYVKRKSNQLVAAPNICHDSEKYVPSSDGYFKRRKNQLVRNPADKQAVSLFKSALNAQSGDAPGVLTNKGAAKTPKHSKFSLVWTLHGTGLTYNKSITLHRKKIFPQLLPWKRPTYSRSSLGMLSSVHTSLSAIGQKLLQLRKRDAIYTRSNHGYSLRKSKVLSIGGPHLKWSKSIERHSKKANEEATLAVAAAVKEKREQCGSASGVSRLKTRSHSSRKLVHLWTCGQMMSLIAILHKNDFKGFPGERVYRIGSIRYKMDSSRRTLWRISDDELPVSEACVSDAKRKIVPRRLLIGTDEYIRIGNGNQLVRDPKKRTRTLATEKVRWSLHTARLRLAKKRKYCQFFTRFGKCNKDDGKCPYIHDPSKVAVCTKFLNGLCANPNCKLTHKVIPERMPDCSYFLQGLCTNESCPYRHVHVNPKASTCDAFLRGYCADGNECRKKHSYICPVFEATGSCSQGSKCKLHHPKKQVKGRKRKKSCNQKNARGRYFGSLHNDMPESELKFIERQLSNPVGFEELNADYISLDVSEEEAGESNDLMTEQTSSGECYSTELQSDDLDELIKPVRIMNPNLTT